MNKKQIKTILKYPILKIVIEIVDRTNLMLTERTAILLVDMQGLSEKEAAEKIKVSRRSIQNYRKSAYRKMSIAFDDDPIAEKILKG